MIRAGVAGLVAAVVPIVGRAAPRAADPPVDDEQQIGQEVFNEPKARVEIIGASPMCDLSRSIAAPIVNARSAAYRAEGRARGICQVKVMYEQSTRRCVRR
jgi:hypothetical protein